MAERPKGIKNERTPAPHVVQALKRPGAPGGRSAAPHVQAAVTAVAQPKRPGSQQAPHPGAMPIRPPAPHVQSAQTRTAALQPRLAPRPVAPPARGRSSVVQRMNNDNNNNNQKPPYSSGSTSKGTVSSNNSWTFTGKGGETLKIVDDGREFKAYLNGSYVGYLSYEIESEEGVRRMRFGYINITATQHRSKKISSVLIFLLAVKTLQSGLDTICVGHPDPNLRAYWVAMGFDFAGAEAKQLQHIRELYGQDAANSLPQITVTEATGAAQALLQWARASLEKYWEG